jgi:hypothetical protein
MNEPNLNEQEKAPTAVYSGDLLGGVCDTCKQTATILCEWGLHELQGEPRKEPMQSATLCNACADDLWSRVKGAVNNGIMHWRNRTPPNDQAEARLPVSAATTTPKI